MSTETPHTKSPVELENAAGAQAVLEHEVASAGFGATATIPSGCPRSGSREGALGTPRRIKIRRTSGQRSSRQVSATSRRPTRPRIPVHLFGSPSPVSYRTYNYGQVRTLAQ